MPSCRLANDHAFNALSIPASRMRVSIGMEDMSALLADIAQAIDACGWKPSLTCKVAPTARPDDSRSPNKPRTTSDTYSAT